MKKHLKNLLLTLFISAGSVQSIIAQKSLSYGIKAGVNLSTSTFEPRFYQSKSPKAGLQIGFTGEYALTKTLYLQSELAFTTKGVQYSGSEAWIGSSNPPVTHWKNIIDQLYLQVPLKLARKFRIGNKSIFEMNAGYYVAYAAGGNNKTKNSYEGVNRPDEVSSVRTFGQKTLKRFDNGPAAGIGLEIKSWRVGLSYELGLKDISFRYPGSPETYPYYNRNLSLTIGYKL